MLRLDSASGKLRDEGGGFSFTSHPGLGQKCRSPIQVFCTLGGRLLARLPPAGSGLPAACLALPGPSGYVTASACSWVTPIAAFTPSFTALDLALVFALFLCTRVGFCSRTEGRCGAKAAPRDRATMHVCFLRLGNL